jgi:hypothetical protein
MKAWWSGHDLRLPRESASSARRPKNGTLFRFVPAVAVEAMRTVPGIKTPVFRQGKTAPLRQTEIRAGITRARDSL